MPIGETIMRAPLRALIATATLFLAAVSFEPAFAASGPFADPATSPPGRLAVTIPIAGDPLRIATGKVSGTLLPNGVKAYFGIPFAAPPIRQYRWREPQAGQVLGWNLHSQ